MIPEETGDGLLVLVASYNEELNLKKTLPSLLRFVNPEDILVIDDGSSDNTLGVATQFGVNTMRNPRNLGRNRAVVRGFGWGIKRGYSQFVCVDADGQHPATDLPRIRRFLRNNPGVDCLIMSRFIHLNNLGSVPLADAFGIIVSSFLVSAGCGQYISDPTTGYIAFSANAANCLIKHVETLAHIVSDNTWAMGQYPLFSKCGFRITELPSRYIPRASGPRKMFTPLKRFKYPFWLLRAFLAVRVTLHDIICLDKGG